MNIMAKCIWIPWMKGHKKTKLRRAALTLLSITLLFLVCINLLPAKSISHNVLGTRQLLKFLLGSKYRGMALHAFGVRLYLVRDILWRVNWLFWTLLFIPFNFAYLLIREHIHGMKKTMEDLKSDDAAKSKFIALQGKINMELQETLAELRIERRSILNEIETYRRKALDDEELAKKEKEEMKKNKSESALSVETEKRSTVSQDQPTRPKSEPSDDSKGRRFVELKNRSDLRAIRNRQLLRNKLDRNNFDRMDKLEELSKSRESGEEKNRTRFTIKKQIEEFTIPEPRSRSTSEVYRKNVGSNRSSSAMMLPNTLGSNSVVARLDVTRATSFTQIISKKVLMPEGKEPGVTIEDIMSVQRLINSNVLEKKQELNSEVNFKSFPILASRSHQNYFGSGDYNLKTARENK